MENRTWVVSHFGARERYTIPRALQNAGFSVKLFTDFWYTRESVIYKISQKARSRYNQGLDNIEIIDSNKKFLFYDLIRKIYPLSDPDKRYDKETVKKIKKDPVNSIKSVNFFGYSYSSCESLKLAKSLGWSTVLGQINPGPEEHKIINEEYKRYFGINFNPPTPQGEYWDSWYEEVENSDLLLANSNWSKSLLIKGGIPESKIRIVPLVYEPEYKKTEIQRIVKIFDHSTPLIILYLGSISIRKGFHILRTAMEEMQSLPVKLHLVGNCIDPHILIKNLPENIKYFGSVSPVNVAEHYIKSDLFILPTLSDGFALTQLEAQYYKLPIITSRYCGEVIKHGNNGILLDTVTVDEIKNSVKYILDNPYKLKEFSENSLDPSLFSLNTLSEKLKLIDGELN